MEIRPSAPYALSRLSPSPPIISQLVIRPFATYSEMAIGPSARTLSTGDPPIPSSTLRQRSSRPPVLSEMAINPPLLSEPAIPQSAYNLSVGDPPVRPLLSEMAIVPSTRTLSAGDPPIPSSTLRQRSSRLPLTL